MPKPVRPPPILPSVPLPSLSARGIEELQPLDNETATGIDAPEADLLGPTEGTLLSEESSSPSAPGVHIPPSSEADTNPTMVNLSSTSAHLQNSAAVQEELTAQLASMARQLKANATYFSEALEADKTALAGADEKIGMNYEVMKKERVRLRDHRGRSMGTTCLTLTSVLVVAIAFVLMFFVIRFT